MNFYELLYAGKNSGALSATYYELLFAKYLNPGGGDEWAEYDGTLPATYTANGSMLADYRVYGAAGGAGDRTINVYIPTETITGEYVNVNGVMVSHSSYNTDKVVLVPGSYVFSNNIMALSDRIMSCASFGSNGDFIAGSGKITAYQPTTERIMLSFDVPQEAEYTLISCDKDTYNKAITPGSTAPAEYVPYGYAVPMSVSDGTTSTTTQIYIGSDPLDEDEYVDYGKQKVYRMSGGALTPTDPPVPLPALPTCDGTTITDYAGQSAAVPSRFYAKYKKG